MHRKVGLPRCRVGGRRRRFAESHERAFVLQPFLDVGECLLDLLFVARFRRIRAAATRREREQGQEQAE